VILSWSKSKFRFFNVNGSYGQVRRAGWRWFDGRNLKKGLRDNRSGGV
jgi:hypothetical protein